MSAIKIDKKIAKYRVQKPADKAAPSSRRPLPPRREVRAAVEMTHDRRAAPPKSCA